MNKKIKKLAKKLEPVCYDVEKILNKHDDTEARKWAQSNSIRHAMLLEKILMYGNQNKSKHIKILNASGLSSGHQDFSIASYLKNNTNFSFSWTAFESPESEFLNHSTFKDYVSLLEIEVKLSDFQKSSDLYGPESDYDVAIFTEIVEHLDHSTFLQCLQSLQKRLSQKGILYLTTPNLLSFWNRKQFLKGDGDFPFWGDGINNLNSGSFGHIINYDINRLVRILKDVGFKIIQTGSFTYVQARYKQTLKHKVFSKVLNWLCDNGLYLGTNLYVIASPDSKRTEIPFRV